MYSFIYVHACGQRHHQHVHSAHARVDTQDSRGKVCEPAQQGLALARRARYPYADEQQHKRVDEIENVAHAPVVCVCVCVCVCVDACECCCVCLVGCDFSVTVHGGWLVAQQALLACLICDCTLQCSWPVCMYVCMYDVCKYVHTYVKCTGSDMHACILHAESEGQAYACARRRIFDA
jgi:hypothetical protein